MLPAGVESVSIETTRGTFAGLEARPAGRARGHILLVTGWTGSKEDFTPLLPPLAAAGFHVTTYDQRGQYETPGAADADYSLDGFGADALAVRAASGFASSHLLGHSFGGLVAQNAALAQASAWNSIALLCSGPGALGEPEGTARPLTMFINAIGSMPLATIHAYREQMDGIDRPPEIAAFLAERFATNGEASLKAMTQILIDAPDRVDAVAALGLPAWVGRGANDDAWPHAAQAEMARRLGVGVAIILGAAHSPAIENTEDTAAALLEFWT